MEHTDFADKVIQTLKDLGSKASDEEHAMLHSDAQCKAAAGWSRDDTIRYMMCTEEVNPDLSEDAALARMKAIRQRYHL